MLNVEKERNTKREDYILSCVNDPNQFEKAISRVKCHTFVDMIKKKKVTVARGVVELRMQRDLFGQLLQISLKKELDLEKVLAYPLTPIPLSMFHLDGTMCKTQKSALMALLEKYDHSEPPENTDVIVYDGYFMLHQMKDVPLSFGNISKKVLQMICATTAKIIYIAFDRYIFPSIKDTEYKLLGMELANFHIEGPDQVRKKDFSLELKNVNFKEALVQFFTENWEEDYMWPYIKDKTIYVSADACYRFIVDDSKVIKTRVEEFSCPAHEEADTKMIFHVCNIDINANVTIRCSDTDVLIIMLANMANISENIHICMEVGVGKAQRFINITQLYKSLGSNLSAALPAFHAFTGCDFNPAFFRKGKKRPFSIMAKSNDFIECFIQMSKSLEDRDNIFERIEEFVCHMYGLNRLKQVNEARVVLFEKTYKFLDTETFKLPKKGIDGSSLPPCKSELYQQFLRACYIAQIWSNAYLKVPTSDDPEDYGWEEINNKYDFTWFFGSQLPTSIDEITIQPEKGNILLSY